MVRVGGVGTVALSLATATCALLLLGGVSPERDDSLAVSGPAPAPDSAPPSTSSTAGRAADTTFATTTTTTTTIATTTATTASTTTTTTPVRAVASPIPLAVAASGTVVGPGGAVTFAGTCATVDGVPGGPLTVWIVAGSAGAVDVVATGVTAAEWTFGWVAPTAADAIRSHTFQFWCGDPADHARGYPLALQRVVDIVQQAAPGAPAAAPAVPATPRRIPTTG